jgi:hypothetical protein
MDLMDAYNVTLSLIEANQYFQDATSFFGRTYVELFVTTVGLFAYAFFVWHFYTRLGKRDLFSVDLGKYDLLPDSNTRILQKIKEGAFYSIKYLLLFPVFTFIWFSVFSFFLFVMTKGLGVDLIIFISVVLVSSTRMASYYNEKLSEDMSKLIPFSLLSLVLTNPQFFSIEVIWERVMQIPSFAPDVLNYLLFTIFFEWTLRALYLIKKRFPDQMDGIPIGTA